MKQFNLLNDLEGNQLPSGTYPAVASGNESKVVQGGTTYLFKFQFYVKGVNIPDVITVDSDGSARSKVLGGQEIKQSTGQQSKSASPNLQPGYYPAQASGYISRVVHNGVSYTFKFENGVRGMNIRDVVAVSVDGSVTSKILGMSIGTEK